MVVYDTLSRVLPYKRSYALKFLSIAFIGIHIPLIGTAIYFALSSARIEKTTMIVFILELTLIATAITLLVLNKLLAPVLCAKHSLEKYMQERQVPRLPVHYEDEVGQLLVNIDQTIKHIDLLLAEKTGVIDILSHDLRSPISRIIGLVQVQKMDMEAGNPTTYSDEIVGECNDMLALLGNVLNTLKHEVAMDKNIRKEELNLAEIVVKSISSYDMQARQKDIRWDIDIPGDHSVHLEPSLFTQAFKNVIGNAIKFSMPGSCIYIRSGISGTLVYLSVRDEGMGFSPDYKEEIFNRFTRAGSRGTAGEPSTGLGLYLSKKIAQRHGGDLIGESAGHGKGATFTFILPYGRV